MTIWKAKNSPSSPVPFLPSPPPTPVRWRIGRARAKNGNPFQFVLLILTLIAVGLWAIQFIFPSLNPAIFVVLGSAVAAVIDLFAIVIQALRRRIKVPAMGVVFGLAAALVLAHAIMTGLEAKRAGLQAVCRVKLSAVARAIDDYRGMNEGKSPSSIKEMQNFFVEEDIRLRQAPWECPDAGHEYVLNSALKYYPDDVVIVETGPSHEPYWFAPIMRRFKSSTTINPGNFTVAQRIDVWINATFGEPVHGVQAYFDDGSVKTIEFRNSPHIASKEAPRPIESPAAKPVTITANNTATAPTLREEPFQGPVSPIKQVTITAPLDGILGRLSVAKGQHVDIGAELAHMNDDAQKAAIAQAELQAEDKSEIQLRILLADEADTRLSRVKKLAEVGAATEAEIHQARMRQESADTKLNEARHKQTLAKETVKLEQAQFDRYHVVAPFSGSVLGISTKRGAKLRQSDPILTLGTPYKLQAQIVIPVRLSDQLEIDRKFQLTAKAPINRELTGRLTRIEPVDPSGDTIRCIFEIDNSDLHLPASFTVQLQLNSKR